MDKADHLENLVKAHPRMEMMSSRKFGNICCRYNPEPGTQSERPSNDPKDINLNDLNAAIRKSLYETGRFMISRSNIGENVILRPVSSNDCSTHETFSDLFNTIVEIGDRLVDDFRPKD